VHSQRWAKNTSEGTPPRILPPVIERDAGRDTVPDFQSPAIHDELRFSIRKAMMQDNVKEAVTFRNPSDQTALPIRRWASFLPGTGLGGR
jgi:gluconate 2-dehydrogenase alpha chain